MAQVAPKAPALAPRVLPEAATKTYVVVSGWWCWFTPREPCLARACFSSHSRAHSYDNCDTLTNTQASTWETAAALSDVQLRVLDDLSEHVAQRPMPAHVRVAKQNHTLL